MRSILKHKPLIGCVHLMPLPGAPLIGGCMQTVLDRAKFEAELLERCGIDALIVENFGDKPFFPGALPPETIAGLTAALLEVRRSTSLPVGVNALRNDASAAMAAAAAAGGAFIRVNVHCGAAVADQGLLAGQAHATLRLRAALRSTALIFADVQVKHAAALAERPIEVETGDLVERGLADAVIVTGSRTGAAADCEVLAAVRRASSAPVLVGSGTTPDNLEQLFPLADGFIVGSWFKAEGRAENPVDEERLRRFVSGYRTLKEDSPA